MTAVLGGVRVRDPFVVESVVPAAVVVPAAAVVVESPLLGLVGLGLVQVEGLDRDGGPVGRVSVPGCECELRRGTEFARCISMVAVWVAGRRHLLNSGEVGMALHLSGREFGFGGDPASLPGALVEGIAAAGWDRVREWAARDLENNLADQRRSTASARWRRVNRELWGSRAREDRMVSVKLHLFDLLREGLACQGHEAPQDPKTVRMRKLRASQRPLGVVA